MEEKPNEKYTTSEIQISVYAKCSQCGDDHTFIEKLEPQALYTGNHTQRAVYWHQQMVKAVNAACEREGWQMIEMAEGPPKSCCGVCIAKARRAKRSANAP